MKTYLELSTEGEVERTRIEVGTRKRDADVSPAFFATRVRRRIERKEHDYCALAVLQQRPDALKRNITFRQFYDS